jgi:hypothetical protein
MKKKVLRITGLLMFFTTSLTMGSPNQKAWGDMGSVPPICYIEQPDGGLIDLTDLCVQSNSSEETKSVSNNLNGFSPLRSPDRSAKCLCPYDLDSSGEVCGSKSVYAEGSPVCYRPTS